LNVHSFIEYLKYRWHALGRHGTHSPFVYDFVERVLQDKNIIPKEYRIAIPALGLRYENIISRMAAHYKFDSVVQLPADTLSAGKPDMAIIVGAKPAEWHDLMDGALTYLHQNGAIVVAGIHTSAAHTAAWYKLSADARVRMNMDMYGIGVLWFRPEFKVPQGFVLKDTH